MKTDESLFPCYIIVFNLPAEPEAKGIVVVVVVESLSEFLEYIGSFWLNETEGDTCSLF